MSHRINAAAPHSMKFEYCGGWGYISQVNAAIEQIEAKMPGQFSYYIYMDDGYTGRLEVTVYKG